MSFLLLVAPLFGVSFGAGYFYGSYTNTDEVVNPLSRDLIVEIQKGIMLKHVEKRIEHNDNHSLLMKEIQSTPILKKVDNITKLNIEDEWMQDLRKKLRSIHNVINE